MAIEMVKDKQPSSIQKPSAQSGWPRPNVQRQGQQAGKNALESFKKRLGKRWSVPRFQTGIPEIDTIFGGLPNGLIIFCGEAGSGKSTMAKFICEQYKLDISAGRKPLFVGCESEADFPESDNVEKANFVQNLPQSEFAIEQLFSGIEDLNPPFVVIDSLTTFLSGTKKAVEEADVRSGCFEIMKRCERICPIIGISQIRGSGQFSYPAGGQAVAHACTMLVDFKSFIVGTKFVAERYNASEGDGIWTINVRKDRLHEANTKSEFEVLYENDFKNIIFRQIKYGTTRSIPV